MVLRAAKWLAAVLLVMLIAMVVYWAVTPNGAPSWTGFGPYDAAIDGPRPKTLWDWLELLLVPLFLAFGAWWLSNSEKQSEQEVEVDRQRQAALEAYLDCMTDLLLQCGLHDSASEEVRSIARTRTLVLLRVLDPERKGQVLQFLYESDLISTNPVVRLIGADVRRAGLDGATLAGTEFRGAYLNGASLRGADLTGADLRGADMSGCDLSDATLSGTDLTQTILSGARLQNADLSDATLELADFTRADLTGAKLPPYAMAQIASLQDAVMPHERRCKGSDCDRTEWTPPE